MANHPLHPISHCQPQPSSQEGKTFIQPSVLRMYYLPRDQQFHLGFNRTAFLPVHCYIFECEYVRTHFVSIFLYLLLLHPSVLQRLSRAIRGPIFSRLAGTQFADYITCLTTNHFVLAWTDTAFLPVHSLLFWVSTCLYMFLFHDLFAISQSQCATKGSAERSTHTILVSRPAHNLPIALPASPLAILFLFQF